MVMEILVLKMGENMHTNLSYQVYTIRMSILLGGFEAGLAHFNQRHLLWFVLDCLKAKDIKKKNIIN